jgi:arylsulfatase A-like enzyme
MTRKNPTRNSNGRRGRARAPAIEDDQEPRSILPLSGRVGAGVTPVDGRMTQSAAEEEELRPPMGAPNVLLVMLDDVGFGATSAFGGPCETPALERVGKNGLRYTRFHTTALSAATRQALLTGRNHHSAGLGCTTEVVAETSGIAGLRANAAATVAQILHMNGYSTAFFGKSDVPDCHASACGGLERGPFMAGFDKFYGYVASERKQRAPTLFDGVTPLEPVVSAQWDLTRELAKQAVHWAKAQQANTPDKPFFMYFAPGGTLGADAPREWIERYRGRFERGWDVVREETLLRQRELGVVPRNTTLSRRPDGVQSWASSDPEERLVAARLMECYAAYVSHADHHVGLLLDTLDELGIAENTLVLYVTGDSSASDEGALTGLLCDEQYPLGWAHAMCTPYQWTRQVASHWGGTRRGMASCWPSGMKARGELRHQFHHVIDVVPTILEATRLPRPVLVNGIAPKPIEGVSMVYSFDDARAPERHVKQYFEMMGNGGIYHEGWSALTKHRTPWITGITALPRFTEDRWELYDEERDPSQCEDIAGARAGRLEELKQLWLIEAAKYQVVPLDERGVEPISEPPLPFDDDGESLDDRPTPVMSPMPRVTEEAAREALARGAGEGR